MTKPRLSAGAEPVDGPQDLRDASATADHAVVASTSGASTLHHFWYSQRLHPATRAALRGSG